MPPLKMAIEGHFFDSHLYRDRLYLFEPDGTLSTYHWPTILDSWDVPPEDRLALTCAFFKSDYLYGQHFDLLLGDPEIRQVLERKFAALSRYDIVVSRHHLRTALIGKQDSPFPFPHSSLEIYRASAYGSSSEGVYKSTTGKHLKYGMSTRPEQLTDIPCASLTASWNTLAMSCGSDGLWEFDLGRRHKAHQLSVLSNNTNDWNYHSIFASSYEGGGYLANFNRPVKRFGYQQALEEEARTFDRIISSREIFGEETDLAWGVKDKICARFRDNIQIVRYDPWTDPHEPAFDKLGTAAVRADFGPVVSAATATFGIIVEFDNALCLLLSNGDVEEIPGEAVNWKAFPRSQYYSNQLHVIYEDRFEVFSFNHDYFVDQNDKTIGTRAVISRPAA